MKPNILLLDIETAPNIAYVWRLYDDYISPDQLVATSHILCVSAKWLGEKSVTFVSVKKHGQLAMLKAIHAMMDEADVVVHYNGTKFDIPNLNREFLTEGLPPPSPIKQVDLLPVVRRQFKFTSNKLDFVCKRLGLGNKVHHKGMSLWHGCLEGEAASWKTMEKYNRQDVVLLENLYKKLVPWIGAHPNYTLYSGDALACPRCGSGTYQSRGLARTTTVSYQRYQCTKCSGWFKGAKSAAHTPVVHRPI